MTDKKSQPDELTTAWDKKATVGPYPKNCPECKHTSHRGRCETCLAWKIDCATRKP
jgi:hypothetical protein